MNTFNQTMNGAIDVFIHLSVMGAGIAVALLFIGVSIFVLGKIRIMFL